MARGFAEHEGCRGVKLLRPAFYEWTSKGWAVRALHHYQDMGILDPIYVDPESNRRFYDIRQSAKIDLIQQLQSIGCSLDEIAELSHGGTVEDIRQAIERHLADIDERAAQLRQSRRTAQALMEGCAELSGNPMLNQILMERLPERRIISFDLGDDIRVDATSDLMEWERATRRTKRLFLEANLPVSLFHDLGSIISLESVQAASPFSARTFVAVDESRGELYDQAEVLPGGTYLTLYFSTKATTRRATTSPTKRCCAWPITPARKACHSWATSSPRRSAASRICSPDRERSSSASAPPWNTLSPPLDADDLGFSPL